MNRNTHRSRGAAWCRPTSSSRRRPITGSRPTFCRAASGPRSAFPCRPISRASTSGRVIYGGTTQAATASLDQNYSLDVGDPEPPRREGRPRRRPSGSPAPAQLTPIVSAPLPPAPSRQSGRRRRAVGRRPDFGVVEQVSRSRHGDLRRRRACRRRRAPGPTGREVPMGTFRVVCTNPPDAGMRRDAAHVQRSRHLLAAGRRRRTQRLECAGEGRRRRRERHRRRRSTDCHYAVGKSRYSDGRMRHD